MQTTADSGRLLSTMVTRRACQYLFTHFGTWRLWIFDRAKFGPPEKANQPMISVDMFLLPEELDMSLDDFEERYLVPAMDNIIQRLPVKDIRSFERLGHWDATGDIHDSDRSYPWHESVSTHKATNVSARWTVWPLNMSTNTHRCTIAVAYSV